MIRIPVAKAHGAGNDFLIVEGSPETLLPEPQQRQRICDRHYGIGADGLVYVALPGSGPEPGPEPSIDANLRIFNQDGGEAEISGNGTRCAAAYILRKTGGTHLTLRTLAGDRKLQLISREENLFVFEMAMGQPRLAASQIPFHPSQPPPEPIVWFPVPLAEGAVRGTITSMGNPHCSVRVENFDFDWRDRGKQIENHDFFPARTNVEFYHVISAHEIEVRYWERGVGETFSSGTGSSAAAVASILNGDTTSPVRVRTVAGVLPVRWEGDGVFLTGPAELLFEGDFLLAESAS